MERNETDRTPAATVVIVNYNSGPRLATCLASLARQTRGDFETIVVDNASSDGSAAPARAAGAKTRLIAAGANLGFAAANNLAAKDARGDWLAFLNPDAYPAPDWLEALLAATARHPGVDAFGSTQIDAGDPARLDGAGDAYFVFGLPYRGHHGWPVSALPEEGETFAPCAAAALWRRSTFLDLGGFDERFFCYGEDVDLGFRLRLAGGRAIQVAGARVRHEGSAITGRRSDFAVYHGHRNRVWTYVKNMPPALFWPGLPVHVAVNLALFAMSAAQGRGGAYARAMIAAAKGMGPIWRERRTAQKNRKIGAGALARVLTWSPWRAARRKALVLPVAPMRA